MQSFSNPLIVVCVLTLSLAAGGPAQAVQTVYNDEASYLADLATLGYTQATDGFEDRNFWGLLEPTATTTVPDVTSRAVRWTGLGGGLDLSSPVARSGNWALESSPPNSPFDGFQAVAEEPLFGFGGWFKAGNAGSGGQNDISAFLNGSPTVFDGFGAPTSNYVFWGVIDTAGISSIQFETEPVDPPEPGSGDPIDPSKTILLDDFTFGFSSAPSLREPGTAWSNAAGGTYTTGGNWNGGTTPLAMENALFHLGSATPYTTTFSQNETASQAVIANDKVAFDLGGFQYNLTETNVTRESLIVGERPGDVGELTVTGGTVAGVNAVVAHSGSSSGHLTVGSGGSVALSGVIRIGSGGTGTLDIHSGGSVASVGNNFIGQLGGNGTVHVDGSGSQWNSTGLGAAITLGSGGGTGSLSITNGATVSSPSLTVGKLTDNGLASDTAGSGTVQIDGSGSTLTASTVTIGLEGAGTMNVTAGGQIAGVNGTIGVSADADVVLDGSGTDWTLFHPVSYLRGNLTVGAGDQQGSFATLPPPPLHTGTLTIQNGATVSTEESFIGLTRTGRGVLTVTGSGSSWTSGSQFSGNTFIGYEGDGELNVLDGATIQTGQSFIGRFGLRDHLRGVANITGTGSTWTTPSTIWVGFNNDPQVYSGANLFFAEGILNVTQGGTVDAGFLSLADRKISKGVVNISGAGSSITAGSASFGKVSTSTFTYGSNAEMTIADGGLLDITGNVDIFHGLLTLDAGTLNANNLQLHGDQLIDPATNQFETGDTRVTLRGNGQINANLSNDGGYVEPGLSAGALHLLGNFTQATAGILVIELGGTDNSDPLNLQYDWLDIDGTATLAGTLDVSLLGGFAPTLGDSFGFLSTTGGLSGTFDTMNLPALSAGLEWLLNPGGNTLFLQVISTPLAGDFNLDGTVDAADYTVWRDGLGTTYTQADYTIWVNNFGNSQSSSTSVPEPATCLLVCLGFLVLFPRRRMKK